MSFWNRNRRPYSSSPSFRKIPSNNSPWFLQSKAKEFRGLHMVWGRRLQLIVCNHSTNSACALRRKRVWRPFSEFDFGKGEKERAPQIQSQLVQSKALWFKYSLSPNRGLLSYCFQSSSLRSKSPVRIEGLKEQSWLSQDHWCGLEWHWIYSTSQERSI